MHQDLSKGTVQAVAHFFFDLSVFRARFVETRAWSTCDAHSRSYTMSLSVPFAFLSTEQKRAVTVLRPVQLCLVRAQPRMTQVRWMECWVLLLSYPHDAALYMTSETVSMDALLY